MLSPKDRKGLYKNNLLASRISEVIQLLMVAESAGGTEEPGEPGQEVTKRELVKESGS